MGSIEATTSCTPSSPHVAVTVEATTSFRLSLSLVLTTHTLYNYLQKCNNNFTFALRHIYTHMTFGLFTDMAPRGLQSVGKITTGPLIIRFFQTSHPERPLSQQYQRCCIILVIFELEPWRTNALNT